MQLHLLMTIVFSIFDTQDSDILRICVDDKRSTLIDRAKGKMSPGLYMRDIAEVRGGFDSYDFTKNTNAPTDPDLCLSLIGSERTISLELPGKVRIISLLRPTC